METEKNTMKNPTSTWRLGVMLWFSHLHILKDLRTQITHHTCTHIELINIPLWKIIKNNNVIVIHCLEDYCQCWGLARNEMTMGTMNDMWIKRSLNRNIPDTDSWKMSCKRVLRKTEGLKGEENKIFKKGRIIRAEWS